MRILSKSTLRDFWEQHPDSRPSLEFWYDVVDGINFNNSNEVISYFNTADVIGKGRIVFNICRNKYRLIVKFEYERKFAFVRFIGNHNDYDKLKNIENI
ncbi:MAG: type II toxin-antitoxin system HigB family toxin [Saprospiraceae bacterium]|nr:type II toxin-antitoxin system HigB family toxin [Candidatus Brachybacter algidus]MBK8747179.1 type II toxin-antitoxin system HigB family toxin [Candidatus Brachybacter algidus]